MSRSQKARPGWIELVAICAGVFTLAWTGAPERDLEAEPLTKEGKAEVFTGDLSPTGDADVQGQVVVKRKGKELSVNVNARNLPQGTNGQHIHQGSSCDSFGGIAVPLDQDLADVESGFGGPFPSTEGQSGTQTYRQKGSSDAFTGLDLGNMTVVVHAGAPGPPVACAELSPRGS